MEENQLETRTSLPTEVDDEDPFIILAELKLSLRQTLTLAMGIFGWFMLMKLTGAILPISGLFAGLLWSWLLLGCVFLTFKKKDGDPYEEYLSQKIQFWVSERYFILTDPEDDGFGEVDEADWGELENDVFYDQ